MNHLEHTLFSAEERKHSFFLRGIKNTRGVAVVELSKKHLGAIGKNNGEYTPQELVELSQEGIDTGGYRMPSLPEVYDILSTLHQNRAHPQHAELVKRVQQHLATLQNEAMPRTFTHLEKGTTLLTSTVALQGYKGGVVHHEGLTIEEQLLQEPPSQFFEIADMRESIRWGTAPKPALAELEEIKEFRKLLRTPDNYLDVEAVFKWFLPSYKPRVRSKYVDYEDHEKRKTHERTRTGITIIIDHDYWIKKDNPYTAIDVVIPTDQKCKALGIRVHEWKPHQ